MAILIDFHLSANWYVKNHPSRAKKNPNKKGKRQDMSLPAKRQARM
jgi:hypothetical protein